MPEETNIDLREGMSRQDRLDCKAVYRLFKSKEGINVLGIIKRDIGWDEAKPVVREGIPEVMNRDEWIGARRVIKAIEDRISKGKRLLDHEGIEQ